MMHDYQNLREVILQGIKSCFCSFFSYYCVQVALDMEVQQTPDEVHTRWIKYHSYDSCDCFSGSRV